jgi:hypothetical protein
MESRTVGKLVRKVPNWATSKRDPLFLLLFMCQSHDLDVFLFAQEDVDYDNEVISGLFFEHQKFVRKLVPIPPVIETGYPGLLDKRLREKAKYCIYRRLGMNKQETFDILEKTKLAENIIRTEYITDYNTILNRLSEDVVLKPVKDSNGNGVIRIFQRDDSYVVNEENTELSFDKNSDGIEKYLKDYFETYKSRIIIQPYIKCRTLENEPFDIRVRVVRKNANSFATQVFPRVGNKLGMRSNLHAGGYTMAIEDFLKREFGDLRPDSPSKLARQMYKEMETMSFDIANILQEECPYNDRVLFDIGFDIGIIRVDNEKGYKYIIFETNSYPAFSTCTSIHRVYNGPQIPLAYLSYYNYIYNTKVDVK